MRMMAFGPDWPNGSTRMLGIVGDPLAHSLSPGLHTAVLRRLDRNLIYLPFTVSEERLETFLRDAPGLGVIGCNVTTPYKEAVARLVQAEDEETERTRTVNTVVFSEGRALGSGTDGAGVLGFLRGAGLDSEPFGILGFGAAARSLAYRAIRSGAPLVSVWTRRPEEVRTQITSWGGIDVRVEGEMELAPEPPRDRQEPGVVSSPALWISTIPPGGSSPPERFWRRASPGVLLDLNYGSGRDARVLEARGHSWRAAGGLGPLCYQAALSLGRWLGEEVPAALFFEALGRPERTLRPE